MQIDCVQVRSLQKYVRNWLSLVGSLGEIKYNKSAICFNDINIFKSKNRSENDKNNKKRENIIGGVINNKIPEKYYKYSLRWTRLKKGIDKYIETLCLANGITEIKGVNCEHKAGRGNHYDFILHINECSDFKIEFKFNAELLNEAPQFVSPMKPSQYLTGSYEEYYYDNYFVPVTEKFNLPLPTKEEYLKSIHAPDPACVRPHQQKYYGGCNKSSKFTGDAEDIKFYNYLKKISKESIKTFITDHDILITKLNDYLLTTQKEKFYMLYKNSKISMQTINLDDYIITEIKKDPRYSRYIAYTKTKNKLKILLRWKNGNGIAFPSFQIS